MNLVMKNMIVSGAALENWADFCKGSYGRLHHGPYLKEYREKWLRRLLEMQIEVNQNGPEEFFSFGVDYFAGTSSNP